LLLRSCWPSPWRKSRASFGKRSARTCV